MGARRKLASLLALLAAPGAWIDASPAAAGVATVRGAGAIERPSPAYGATLARVVAPSVARQRPAGGRGQRVSVRTSWSGQPQTLLVLRAARHRGRAWLRVLLSRRPNGSTGWLPRDRVLLSRSRWWVEIDTDARRVTLYRRGRRVRSFRAVVGAPGTPTPRGLAAIYERNPQPNPRAFLGPWSLPLTVHSRVLRSFGGGPGRVAIHGRSGASLLDPLGSARSHGCIRVDNPHISFMASRIPAGTPVLIR